MVAWLGFKQVAFEYDRNARFAVQLLVLGLIGEYVGRTYIQSKHRFVISHLHRRARLPDRLPQDPLPRQQRPVISPFEQAELDAEADELPLGEIGR
jgi:hypothetical protein